MQPLSNKKVSLPHELAYAAVGALATGGTTFAGTVSFATSNDTKALAAAALSAGLTALAFFSNSLRNWLNQNQ